MVRRKGEDHQVRKQQILDAALEVFAQKGYIRATNSDIARAAGIRSPGLIYHYFRDKRDLLDQVMQLRMPVLQLVSAPSELKELPPRELLTRFAHSFLSALEPIRQEWLDAIVKFQRDPERPQGEAAWSPALDLASADELSAIQSAKLPLAVRFAYQSIPFYRRKFDRIGLEPGDVRGLDDLAKIPITTKQEMADDVAENPPWGTYTWELA